MKAIMAEKVVTGMAGIAGASVAAVTTGPLAQLFNEASLAIAIMGMLGGATSALALKKPWRETIRPGLIGASMAIGLSAFGPALLSKMLDIELSLTGSGIEGFGFTAYAIGFAQERITNRLTKEPGNEG